jgi:hypothetical protein
MNTLKLLCPMVLCFGQRVDVDHVYCVGHNSKLDGLLEDPAPCGGRIVEPQTSVSERKPALENKERTDKLILVPIHSQMYLECRYMQTRMMLGSAVECYRIQTTCMPEIRTQAIFITPPIHTERTFYEASCVLTAKQDYATLEVARMLSVRNCFL